MKASSDLRRLFADDRTVASRERPIAWLVTGIDDLLIFLPAEAKGPARTIISMNFKGNHTVTMHPSVIAKNPRFELRGQPDSEEQIGKRGSMPGRFPVDKIITRGWGLITSAREDILVDAKEADFEHGVFGPFPGERQPEDWGGMAAWAWRIQSVRFPSGK